MVTSHDGIRGPACPVKSVITQRALNQSYAFVVSRNFAEEASALRDRLVAGRVSSGAR